MHIKVTVAILLALLFYSAFSVSETYSSKHEEVKKFFRSNEEKTAKDASWTAQDIFKVGVINDGTSRNGYAQYVCSVLNDYGFKGKKVWVQIIDIVKLTSDGKWVNLGEAHCNNA
jgi:hypothetical protein